MKNRNKRFKSMPSGGSWIAAAVLIILGSVVGVNVASYFHEETAVCTVVDKDLRVKTEADSAPRVYTEECGTLVVADVPFVSWNSGDIYGEVQVGETYEVTTRGWRVPILSMFPTIVEVEKSNTEE